MRRFTRDRLFLLNSMDDFSRLNSNVNPQHVKQGESFLIETAETGDRIILTADDMKKPYGPMAGNPLSGPVFIEGIQAGDVIAIHIEHIDVTSHSMAYVRKSTAKLPSHYMHSDYKEDFLLIKNGRIHFPCGVDVPVKPMYGCLGVVPATFVQNPWHHGGNMDIPDICAGNTIHVRCERDGGLFFCGDGHAAQGEGELAGQGVEVAMVGQLRIEKSKYQNLSSTMLVETPDSFVAVSHDHSFMGAIQSALVQLSTLLVETRHIDIVDAYEVVHLIADLRLGAICFQEVPPHQVCLRLHNSYFQPLK